MLNIIVLAASEWDPQVTFTIYLAQVKKLWQKPQWSAETRQRFFGSEVKLGA